MKLKYALKFMLMSYCVATTFQVFMLFIFATAAGSTDTVYARELYSLLVISLFSALPILIFVRKESAPRWEWILRRALHLLLTTGLVFAALIYFDWVSLENLWWVLLFFLGMYALLAVISEIRTKRLANQINARIRASHDSENASH